MPQRFPRRSARAAGAIFAVSLLSGCQTDVRVFVESSVRGRGVVRVTATLDDDAAKAAGPAASAIAAPDLAKAGWAVDGLGVDAKGHTTIGAERSFANATQANAVLRQLSGKDGPLPVMELRTHRDVTSRSVSLRGTADLRRGLAAFGDERLQALLGSASRLGIDDAEVARQAGTPVGKAFRFEVVAALGGSRVKTWAVPVGRKVAVSASDHEWAWATLASLAALLLGLSGIAALLLGPDAARRDRADRADRGAPLGPGTD